MRSGERENQRAFRRNTGNQDRNLGQFVLYRLRFLLAGDLAGAWADYGGTVAQINHLAVVLDLSITDHPGIAVTYDHRMHRKVHRIAKTRSTRTGYFELLSNLNKEVRTDVIRDFEARADAQKKEKEKEKAGKEKEKEKEPKKKGGGGKEKDKGKGGRWGRKWSAEDWASYWKTKLSTADDPKAGETEKKKTGKGKKKKEDSK